MLNRNIKCDCCGYEGKVEAHDTVKEVSKSDIFKLLGKDTSTGFIYFKCPFCNEDIAVDPLKAIATKMIVGYPKSDIKTENKDKYRIAKHRLKKTTISYLPIWLVVLVILAINIFFKLQWFRIILTSFLLLIILRSSIPNIKSIFDIYRFYLGYDRAVKNNIYIAIIGLVATIYGTLSLWLSLPLGTSGIIIGFLCSLINSFGMVENHQ